MIKKLFAYFMHLIATKWFAKYILSINIKDDEVDVNFNYFGEEYTQSVSHSDNVPETVDSVILRNTIRFEK